MNLSKFYQLMTNYLISNQNFQNKIIDSLNKLNDEKYVEFKEVDKLARKLVRTYE